ncbi:MULTISPECIES: AsmA family protein [Chitinophagaceae]
MKINKQVSTMWISEKTQKILKWTGYVLGSIIILLVIALSIADFYISSHKEKVISTIQEKVHNATGAQLDIGGLDVSIWRDFPRLRVGLANVQLKDTAFKKPLLLFASIYTKINLLKALFGNVKVSELQLVNGQINLLTDTSGYSNLSLFKSRNGTPDSLKEKDKNHDLGIRELYIENVQFVLDDKHGGKNYDIHVNKIRSRIDIDGAIYKIKMFMNVKLGGLAFNTQKGPFLHNKTLETDWNNMQFNSRTGDLTFDKSPVKIDGHIFNIGGGFNFNGDSTKSKLDLKVDSKGTTFKDCASLLASNIQTALDNYTCTGKVDVAASLYGSLQQSTPHVLVKMIAPNNAVGIKTLGTQLDSCSFIGNYNNQNNKSLLPDDKNSTIIIEGFKGNMTGVPFVGEKINVTDLEDPDIDLALKSASHLVNLNHQLDMETISFLDGDAVIFLTYKGRVPSGLGLLQNLSGEFVVHNGKAIYVPKQLLFENCNGTVAFTKNNLKVDNLRATLNNNSIFVNIDGNSIVADKKGGASVGYINCDVNAPYLNLDYFAKLFQQASSSKPPHRTSAQPKNKQQQGALAASPLQVDNLLNKGEFRLNVRSKEIKYNNFAASNFTTNIVFKDENWQLKKFYVNHAGGSIALTGTVTPTSGNANKTKINLNIEKVQLDKLLYAFDNFGVNGLSYKNLKGTLSAQSQLTTVIDSKGSVIPRSSVGFLHFNLSNGQLLNFPPLLSIQKYVFKKRDLNNVRFASLNDSIWIRHGNFFINRMEIASTALRLFVEGIYSPYGNTDISIQVPFSTLLKKQEKEDALEKTDSNEKVGASVYLRATGKDGGPIGVKVDVFKKLRKDNIKERFEQEFGKGED